MFRSVYIFLFSFVTLTMVHSQTMRIDEDYSDWIPELLRAQDDIGDGRVNSIDFESLYIADDQENIYMHFDLGREIEIQEFEDLYLYIDIDNNTSTGVNAQNIGADFVYRFGQRDGYLFLNNTFFDIYHNDIGLVTLPTVSSDKFEISISKSIDYFQGSISLGHTIRMVLVDNQSGGDRFPDQGAISYTMENSAYDVPDFELLKTNLQEVRILSYNVLQDGLFESSRQPSFTRILRALNPDIICFQEIYNFSPLQVAQLMEVINPSEPNEQWHYSGVNPDVILISKFPITETISSDGNGIFEVEVDEEKIVIVGAHLPCCNNDMERQLEVDKILNQIRNSINGLTNIDIVENTPIFVLGDMNLVGDRQQQISLLTGDIVNENLFGEDFSPDWDGTSFDDAKPFVTGSPHATTWYNPFGSFSAGRLDYLLYTGSVVEVTNSFALKTGNLSPSVLNNFNLESDDVETASDHFPCIIDVNLAPEIGTSIIVRSHRNIFIYPNPSTESISCQIDDQNVVREVEIRSINNQLIEQLDWRIDEGHTVKLSVSHLPPGAYIMRIITSRNNYVGEFIKL